MKYNNPEGVKNHGPTIYFDKSLKGKKGRTHWTYRLDITVNGCRYRKRSKDRDVLVQFLGMINDSWQVYERERHSIGGKP